jgi:hypothetical protein
MFITCDSGYVLVDDKFIRMGKVSEYGKFAFLAPIALSKCHLFNQAAGVKRILNLKEIHSNQY